MNEDYRKQIESDIELAKNMANIASSQELTALNTRIIGHLEFIEQAEAEHDYKARQLRGKAKILMEFLRVGKDRAKTLSIIEHESK